MSMRAARGCRHANGHNNNDTLFAVFHFYLVSFAFWHRLFQLDKYQPSSDMPNICERPTYSTKCAAFRFQSAQRVDVEKMLRRFVRTKNILHLINNLVLVLCSFDRGVDHIPTTVEWDGMWSIFIWKHIDILKKIIENQDTRKTEEIIEYVNSIRIKKWTEISEEIGGSIYLALAPALCLRLQFGMRHIHLIYGMLKIKKN